MPRTLFVIPVAAALLLGGCGGPDKKTDDKAASPGACTCSATPTRSDSKCTCAEVAANKNGWCDHCGVGQVNGQKTTCMVCAKSGKMCDQCAANGGKPCADCQAKMPK